MTEPVYVEFIGGPRDGEVLALPPGGEGLRLGYTLAMPTMWATDDRLVYGDVVYMAEAFDESGMFRMRYVKTSPRSIQ